MNQFSPRPFASATPRAGTPGGGVPVTPGVGATIATDKVGDVDVQVIKLGIGGAGAADMLDYGQQPAAKSLPVVLASDQGNISVTVPPGGATEATLLTVALEATQQQVLTALNAVKGFVDGLEAGQTAGNATLTAIQGFVDGLEAGQATANAHLAAIETSLAAGGAIPPATSTVTAVNAAVASTLLLAANVNRKGASVYNDSAAEMYLKLGAGASNVSFSVDMLPGSYYEIPYGYTGVIHGIWASATGSARVTELTP